MTEKRDVTGVLQDLSVLYELSLSVGQSVKLQENCEAFLRTLMARKNLAFSSVWIHSRFISGEDEDDTLVQVYANPAFRAPESSISLDHPLAASVKDRACISISHGEPGFQQLITGPDLASGTFAVYRLGGIGVLKLYSSARDEPFSDLELNKLCGVVDKFAVSLKGCLDHARVRAAEQRRSDLELQMLKAQKLESLGLLAGGVAHDFNNILTAILGNAELARLSLGEEECEEYISSIIMASKRASELSSQLLAYSGGAPMVGGALDLNATVEEILRLTSITISKKASLQTELGEDLPPIEADSSRLQQVIMNLLTNASEALEEEAGELFVRTGIEHYSTNELVEFRLGVERTSGTYAFLEVEDSGCGMDAETQEKLFDPFFTTKFTGRGLGLAALLGIVRGHQGAIRVRSELGRGTCVRVILPLSEKQVFVPHPSPESVKQAESRSTVLVVDDEEPVRKLLGKLLTRLGARVLFAEDGGEGVEVFERHREEIDLVLLDLTMPVMSGDEAFKRIIELDPEAHVVLCSGYSESKLDSLFEGRSPAAFLEKPFYLSTVTKVIRRLTELPQVRN